MFELKIDRVIMAITYAAEFRRNESSDRGQKTNGELVKKTLYNY